MSNCESILLIDSAVFLMQGSTIVAFGVGGKVLEGCESETGISAEALLISDLG